MFCISCPVNSVATSLLRTVRLFVSQASPSFHWLIHTKHRQRVSSAPTDGPVVPLFAPCHDDALKEQLLFMVFTTNVTWVVLFPSEAAPSNRRATVSTNQKPARCPPPQAPLPLVQFKFKPPNGPITVVIFHRGRFIGQRGYGGSLGNTCWGPEDINKRYHDRSVASNRPIIQLYGLLYDANRHI